MTSFLMHFMTIIWIIVCAIVNPVFIHDYYVLEIRFDVIKLLLNRNLCQLVFRSGQINIRNIRKVSQYRRSKYLTGGNISFKAANDKLITSRNDFSSPNNFDQFSFLARALSGLNTTTSQTSVHTDAFLFNKFLKSSFDKCQ